MRRIGIIAIIAIMPNDDAREAEAVPEAAPIARGSRNVELIGPVATPPESKASGTKFSGTKKESTNHNHENDGIRTEIEA